MAITSYSLTVNFNANGGSGGPSSNYTSTNSSEASVSLTVSIPSSIPSRTGYNFLGWALSSSASSASYSAGGSYTATVRASAPEVSVILYAVWRLKTYTVSYKKGSNGTGTNTSDTKTHGVALTLKNGIFTRTGYDQNGWATSDGGSKAYNLGGSYTANASVTLYPTWAYKKSTFTVTSSVPADGSTQGTVSITRYNSSFTHTVKITLGEQSTTYTNVGTSQSFTIPDTWISEIPSATSATATVKVTTYNGSDSVGSSSKIFTVTVPSSVVPTIDSFTSYAESSNNTVSSWGVLVQGFSKIRLSASATAGNGSTIKSIAFLGDGVSQAGTLDSALSSVLTTSGNRTWTVTVTDARGRTATQSLTETVYEYFTPSITQFAALRALSNGAVDVVGTYVLATPVYSIASCGGHNTASTATISYKLNTAESYITAQTGSVSGTGYTIGDGNIAITNWYDVKFDLTDDLGNSASYVVHIPTAFGASFGLNGKCARLGGPVQHDDRFECDWMAQFDDDVEIQRDLIYAGNRILKTLWQDDDNGWTAGSITVDGISAYRMFIVRFLGLGTSALVFNTESSGEVFFRGEGGYSTSANGETRLYINATLSGDTLTMVDCHQITASGARIARTVSEIIGII